MRSSWWQLLVVAIFWLASPVKGEDASPPVGTANARARLQKRLAEFEALKAEIAELEELAGVSPQQYVIRIQLIELSLTKQRNAAVGGWLPVVSLDSPGDATANAAVVAGWISNQLAKVLVDQTLTSVDGRQASIYVAGSRVRQADVKPGERTRSASPPSLQTIDDSRIDITPILRPDGNVHITFDVCRGDLAGVGGAQGNGESALDKINDRWQSSITMVPGESVVAARTSSSWKTAQAGRNALGFKKARYSVNELQTLLLVTLEPQQQLVQRHIPRHTPIK